MNAQVQSITQRTQRIDPKEQAKRVQKMYESSQKYIQALEDILRKKNEDLIEKNELLMYHIKDEATLKKISAEIERAKEQIKNHDKKNSQKKTKEEIKKINDENKERQYRKNLERYNGTTQTFIMRYQRDGVKRNGALLDATCLFKEVRIEGSEEIVTNHIWINKGARVAKLDLKFGDIVKMTAEVTTYQKNRYQKDRLQGAEFYMDYQLSNPRKLEKIEESIK